MNNLYVDLKNEMRGELKNILDYWSTNTLDTQFGGFQGRISHTNKVIPKASKGIILNSRILWSFSAAANFYKTNEYQSVCDRAYTYLHSFFRDKEHGGVFWEVDFKGKPINSRKQVYAQAFMIYALSEYYESSGNTNALSWAIEIFELLENNAKDEIDLGYTEAFDQEWNTIDDMRLSSKDMNAAKTMNTHLHVLEAYTRLLTVYKNDRLRSALKNLVLLFQTKFLNKNYNYELFFTAKWKLLSSVVSYGHDIETGWLVIEAAKAIGDKSLLQLTEDTAVKVADTFLKEAIDLDGGVFNEKNRATNKIDTDKHWWPQVEAIIGLDYVYLITKNEKYIQDSLRIWEFTKKHMIDSEHGEWHARVNQNGTIYTNEDKVNMWKAPYHTSRACIQLNKKL